MRWFTPKSRPWNDNFDIYLQLVDSISQRGTYSAPLQPFYWGRIIAIIGKVQLDGGSSAIREFFGSISRGGRTIYPIFNSRQMIGALNTTWFAVQTSLGTVPTFNRPQLVIHIPHDTYVYQDDSITITIVPAPGFNDWFTLDTIVYQRWEG